MPGSGRTSRSAKPARNWAWVKEAVRRRRKRAFMMWDSGSVKLGGRGRSRVTFFRVAGRPLVFGRMMPAEPTAPRDLESQKPAAARESGHERPMRLRDLTPHQRKSGLAAWLGWLFDGLDMHIYT